MGIEALLLQRDALGAKSGGMGGGRASESVCFQPRGSSTDARKHGCLHPSKSGGGFDVEYRGTRFARQHLSTSPCCLAESVLHFSQAQ